MYVGLVTIAPTIQSIFIESNLVKGNYIYSDKLKISSKGTICQCPGQRTSRGEGTPLWVIRRSRQRRRRCAMGGL